jgi:hypothetical protein
MSQPVAVRSNKDIDPSLLLGNLLFLNMTDLTIHKDDLTNLFKKHNLPLTFMPNEIKPHDAYRRATQRAAQAIEINYNGAKTKAKLLVREVVADQKKVERHLVREVIDTQQQKPLYISAGKMIFNRDTELMEISWDPGYLTEYDYKQVLTDIQTLYTEWTEYHTKDTVRNIVNKIVKSMHPVSVMQGGRAQFIPKVNQDMLYDLKSMIEELPGGSIAEIIPMIDSTDQRDLITKNLEQEVLADVDRLLNDFNEVLQKETIRKDTFKRYAAAVIELQEKTEKYENLLASKMEVLNQQLRAALSKVQSAAEDAEATSEE